MHFGGNMDFLDTDITPFIVLAVQGLLAWALWSIRRIFVRGDEYLRHIEQEGQLRNETMANVLSIEGRLLTLEERVAQLPDAGMLSDLANAVESLRGDIKTVDMRITGVDRLMQRLERVLERQWDANFRSGT